MAVGPLLTLGQVGFGAAGAIAKGAGDAAGYRHAEDKAQRMALAARTAADETDAQLREELTTTLGNIEAIRAAANIDPTSPTGLAIMDEEQRVSDRQRRIKVGSLKAQATQYDRDAAFYGSMAGPALGLGFLNAFSGGIKTLAGLGR